MSQFLHEDNDEANNDNNDNIKAVAIPWIFSENSQAKNAGYLPGLEISISSPSAADISQVATLEQIS